MLFFLSEISLPSLTTLINPHIKAHLGHDDLPEAFSEFYSRLAAHLLFSHNMFINYYDQMLTSLSCAI